MTVISLPDSLDNAGISFHLNNQAGMSGEESYTYDVVPEISSIVSVVPSDAHATIQLIQNKDALYETYEVTSDDGTTLMTVSSELIDTNKVELTVSSLINTHTYNFKVRAINVEGLFTDWVTVSAVTPSKVPAAMDILSVQRFRSNHTVIVTYDNPLDAEASEAFTMNISYTKLNGDPVNISYPLRVDISGNVII